MSTMLIPEEHIDVIVEYAANPLRDRISYYFMGTWNTIGIQVKADELGQMLLTANIESFNKAHNEDVAIPKYKFRNASRKFTLVEIFKAIECLNYNIDFQGIEAVAALTAIRETIIATVFRQMGYENADGWTIQTNLSRETREGKAHRLYSEMIAKTREGEKMFPKRLPHTVTTTEMFVRQMYSGLIAEVK